jgi:flagellar hook-length control protein FliK
MNQTPSALIPILTGTNASPKFNALAMRQASPSLEHGLFSAQLAQSVKTLIKPNATTTTTVANLLKVAPPAASLGSTSNTLKIAPTAASLGSTSDAASTSGVTGTPVTPSTPIATLQKSILDQLNAGTSVTDIANRLAKKLAAQVAQQLGVTTDAARQQLQTAFASALAPPGQTGPPQTTAEIAQTLAQQFAKVADAATRVASSGESGQLNRFVGNILDANTAKEPLAPAPTTNTAATKASASGTSTAVADSVARDTSDSESDKVTRALVAFQAQLNTPIQSPSLANPVAIAAAAASDGRTVKLETTQAIASAGDTPLGRILARAAQAADLASGTTVAEGDTTSSASTGTQTTPLVSRSLTDAAVTSFLQSFASATKTADDNAPASKTTDDGSFASLLLPSSAGAPDAPAFMAVAPPFSIDTSQIATPAAPSMPAQPQATPDANAIVGQVLQGAFLTNLGQSNQFRMNLVPEHLGEVNIKLTVTDGNVSAHIIAQTPEVHDALVAGQAQLTKSFADAGLKLTSFNVDVANNGFAGFAQQQQQQSQSQQRSSQGQRTLLGSDADDSGETLQAIPSFGPPLLANQNFGALNYLV